jgi:serine/threonine protein kinase
LGRKTALKILPARYTTDSALVHRFEREAKAASALNHPNILTVYEIGQTDDSHFIATEYITGETLRARLQRATLLLGEALDIALQLAAALTAAHEAGIIHRDIKPENIMLRPDGYVKVLDFGLAKLTEGARNPDESTTQTGLIMGTPSYMSPEQARGQHVDARTDIWSFGVVLFEMVSGARPFSGNTQADLLVSILEREPATLPNHLPEPLPAIIARTLAKEPSQRYATMRELIDELRALRRKVEFAAELKLVAQADAVEAVTLRQSAEAETLRLTPETSTQAQPPAPPEVVQPARFPARAVVAGLALVAVLGATAWYALRPASVPAPPPVTPTVTSPKRELTWWLTVQRRQNGKLESKAFQSAGRDWFPNGSRIQVHLTSPQAGFLYLLNEGPTTGGRISLNLLHPTPKNNLEAAVAAAQPVQTGSITFDEHQGEEKLWIVWAAQPVAAIEAVKADLNGYEIRDAAASAAILKLLNEQTGKSTATSDEAQERTVVKGDELVVQLVKLKHR